MLHILPNVVTDLDLDTIFINGCYIRIKFFHCSLVLLLFTLYLTIVAIGHELLKKFLAYGNRLSSTHCREFHYFKLCRPAYFVLVEFDISDL